MEQISSKKIYILKLLLVLWLGLLALIFVIAFFLEFFGIEPFQPFLFLTILVFGAVGYLLKRYIDDTFVEEVFDVGDHLVLKDGEMSATIKFSEIKSVEYYHSRPERIIIELRTDSPFGRKFSFIPLAFTSKPVMDVELFKNSIAESLKSRI